ncbi:MAG: cell division protein PerM [Actinomycetes bacterium]
MTDLISRPPKPRPPRPSDTAGARPRSARTRNTAPAPQPVSWAGVLAALRAAGLGLLAVMVLVLVAWASAADSGASAPEAVAAGLQIWLVGHGARLVVPGGEFGLTPLGLTLLPGVLLFSSAARAARAAHVRGRRGVVALTAVLTASYAAVAVVVSLLAGSDVVQPMPMSAFQGAAALAVVAGGAGALRGRGRAAAWWARLPASYRLATAGASGAVTVLLTAGSLLVGLMLARHHGGSTALVRVLDAGGAGDLLILLTCLLYLPTAAVWGATYLLGPGFAVGTGTSVAVTGVHLAAVPSLPLLAALPGGSGAHGWVVAVAAAGLAAVTAGLLVDRSARREPVDPLGSWRDLGRLAGLTGGLSGLVLALLSVLTSGPAGPGRLAHAGPTWWLVGLVTFVEVGAVVAAVLAVRRRGLLRRGPVDHAADVGAGTA